MKTPNKRGLTTLQSELVGENTKQGGEPLQVGLWVKTPSKGEELHEAGRKILPEPGKREEGGESQKHRQGNDKRGV